MAANTGERTLTPGIIPPRSAHVDGVFSVSSANRDRLAEIEGFTSSLLLDFAIRAVPKSTIREPAFSRLPFAADQHPLAPLLRLRALRLNCPTNAYADLWETVWVSESWDDVWASGRPRENRPPLAASPKWSSTTPLRIAEDRRQALIEIDALVAIMLNVSADELCTVYRTQFPVLYGYDCRRDFYDSYGRLVPSSIVSEWRKRGEGDGLYLATHPGSGIEYTYRTPFTLLNRERDLRQAHEVFSERLRSRRPNSA